MPPGVDNDDTLGYGASVVMKELGGHRAASRLYDIEEEPAGETFRLGWTVIRASKAMGSSRWRLMVVGSQTGASWLLAVYGGGMRGGSGYASSVGSRHSTVHRTRIDSCLPGQPHCAVRVRRKRPRAPAIVVLRCAGSQSLWSS